MINSSKVTHRFRSLSDPEPIRGPHPKDGHMWKVVSKIFDPESGGNFYAFSSENISEEEFAKRSMEKFPAVEAPYNPFYDLPVFKKLGYSFAPNSMILPDIRALNHRLEQDPKLRHIKITSSKGISGDLPFAEASIPGATLSDEGEFVHDHLAHILTRIHLEMNMNFSQKITQENIHGSIMIASALCKKALLKVKPGSKDDKFLQNIIVTLGSNADLFSAKADPTRLELFPQDFFYNWENPLWKKYFEKRLGKGSELSPSEKATFHERLLLLAGNQAI